MAPHYPQPTTPMESLVVLVKKLSKMAGNSASKPLNSTPNELPYITVEWCGRSSVHSRDTQHLIFKTGISKYL